MKTIETKIKARAASLHVVGITAGVFELTEDEAGNIKLTFKTMSVPTLEVMLHDPHNIKPEELDVSPLTQRAAIMVLKETITHLEQQIAKSGADVGVELDEEEKTDPGVRN